MKVPRRFIDRINARDVPALGKMLGEGCRIIDARGAWMEGRKTCVEGMENFFRMEPDYRIHVDSMVHAGGNVLIKGHTTARDPRFTATTLWRARADGSHVHEWQSYSSQFGPSLARLIVGDKAQMGPFLEGTD